MWLLQAANHRFCADLPQGHDLAEKMPEATADAIFSRV
jgi:hypothetical protein